MKKVAIITGCAKGIGKEIALELARDGYDIIGTYNTSLKEINLLKERIENIGVRFDCYKLDLLNNIDEFTNSVLSKYQKIDILINNAALSLDNDFENKTKNEFQQVLGVNVIGPFLLIQKLRDLLDGGIVINISSTDGINTYSTLNIDYSASKAALINLTKSLALTLPNIKMYAICPNWVNTESIREMDQVYLKSELNRVNQNKLIEPSSIAKKVIEIKDSNLESGKIVIMEDENDR